MPAPSRAALVLDEDGGGVEGGVVYAWVADGGDLHNVPAGFPHPHSHLARMRSVAGAGVLRRAQVVGRRPGLRPRFDAIDFDLQPDGAEATVDAVILDVAGGVVGH